MNKFNAMFPYFVILSVVFLWSSASIAGKLLGSDMHAGDISVWRTLFGMLAVLFFIKRASRETRGDGEIRAIRFIDYFPLWMIGIVGFGLMQWLFFLSAQHTYASHLVLIMSLTPLFVKFLRYVVYRESVTVRVWAGSALAMAGSAVILKPEESSGSLLTSGDWLAVGAMIAFAIYTEGMNTYGTRLLPAAANLHVMGAGLFFLILVAAWSHFNQIGMTFRMDLPDSGELAVLLYLGIVTTGIAYLGYSWVIRKMSAAVVTPYLYLQPVFGVLLSWIILKEHVTWRLLGGILLILMGLYVVQRSVRKRESEGTSSLLNNS